MPPIKRQLAHLKNARLASVEHFKKQKLERSQSTNTEQFRIEDDQLRTSDTSDTEDREGVWFWNESANETDSDSECSGKSDEGELDCGPEESRTEKEAVLETRSGEIKWNKEGEKKSRGGYGKGSRATTERRKKVAKELEKEASKTYNIMALWRRNQDLGLIPEANTQPELAKDSQSGPSCEIDPLYPLSQVPFGCALPQSSQQIEREQRTVALKDMTRLVELVTEQENKYKERLSPQSNFYRRHMMVQQFLQIQLRTQSSQTWRNFALSIARSFGRNHITARNIVQWKKSWIAHREIPRQKDREDYVTWMDNEELQESIRDFARSERDRLNLYKLVQYLRDYVNPQGIQAPVKIKS